MTSYELGAPISTHYPHIMGKRSQTRIHCSVIRLQRLQLFKRDIHPAR